MLEEGLGRFYAEQEARAYSLYELQKRLQAEFPDGDDLTGVEDMLELASKESLEQAKSIWGFISDYEFDSGADTEGFMQTLELGMIGAETLAKNIINIPKHLIKDMNQYSTFRSLVEDIAKFQKELAAESQNEAYWKERVVTAGGKLKSLLEKGRPTPCPSGQHRDPLTSGS